METMTNRPQHTNGATHSTPVPAPDVVTQSTTVSQSTVATKGAGWLHTQLRNLIALALTGLITWLALTGNESAMSAVIAAFSVLMGAIWGERAALKVPGQDS